MPKPSLEDRLEKLEQQVATLVGGSAPIKKKKNANGRQRQPLVSRNQWQQTLGRFGPEDGMEEVFEAAMQLREEDRKQARRTRSLKPTNKKLVRRKLARS